jgi:hypothetical protein
MKTIKYNNKEYKMPFDVELPEDPTIEVEVKNRFTGESNYNARVCSSCSLRCTIIGSVRCSVTMIQYVRDLIGSSNTLLSSTW